MAKGRGFTIIELLIVLAVMGILLVLGVVEVSSSQVHARDNERKGDAETLATALEAFYMGASGTQGQYRYPSTCMIQLLQAGNNITLPDIDQTALISPSNTDGPNDTSCTDTNPPAKAGVVISVVSATNTNQTTSGVTPQPSSSNDVYVYQPLTAAGALCTAGATECVEYNIYYYQESDNSVHMVTSRHQWKWSALKLPVSH